MAKLSKASPKDMEHMLGLGGPFALVPRGYDARGKIIVYRKDFMPHLEKKLKRDAEYSQNSQKLWDLHFSSPDVYDFSN